MISLDRIFNIIFNPMKIFPDFVLKRIKHRANFLKIVDNFGWLFVDKVLRMGVGVLVWVWIARHLGPEQFGILNFALAFISLFGAFAGLGMQGIVVRELIHNPQYARLLLGTTALLQSIGGLLAFLAALLVIFYLRPDDLVTRIIVAILSGTILLKGSEVAIYWYESQIQSKYIVWVQGSIFLAFCAIKILLILDNISLIALAWVILAEGFITAISMLLLLNAHQVQLISLRANIGCAKTLLNDSWPLLISSLSIIIYMKIDQIMLGQMIGDEAVGVYSAATKISEVWYFVPMIIVSSVFPAILDAKKKSEHLYLKRFQNLYDLMVIVSVTVAALMTFLSKYIIGFLYGGVFMESDSVLSIHIWASVFVFLGVAGSKWYLTENRLGLDLQRMLVGALSNIFFNLALIPNYGVIGAAVGLVLSQVLSSWIFDCFYSATRPMFLMKFAALNPFSLIPRIRSH